MNRDEYLTDNGPVCLACGGGEAHGGIWVYRVDRDDERAPVLCRCVCCNATELHRLPSGDTARHYREAHAAVAR